MRNTQRYKKIIKVITIALMLLAPIAAFLFVFLVIGNQPISSLFASQSSVSIGATVIPDSPVENSQPFQSIAELPNSDSIKSLEYRIITPLDEETKEASEIKKNITTPLSTLQGKVIYPYSKVILEISSETLYVSVESDAYGNWSWTNYGSLFEEGEHSVNVYNFSPVELSGQRSVFVERHTFLVSGDGSDMRPALLSLNKDTSTEIADIDHFFNRLLQESFTGHYYFDISLLDNKLIYRPGEEIIMQLSFVPLHASFPVEASFEHELFFLTSDGSLHRSIGLFEDSAIIDLGTFEKKFQLKSSAGTVGDYILKTDVKIGNDTYTQSVFFEITPVRLVTFGGVTIGTNNINRILLWNLLFFLLVFASMLLMVASEYRRLFTSEPIDEETLFSLGYIKK